ncbi:hypothetical protein CPB85DRAFT_1311286 [Mucidula mucida]|nr:hypothetical protein CPB85DRAFT_1311286 [Mucidula mucida]
MFSNPAEATPVILQHHVRVTVMSVQSSSFLYQYLSGIDTPTSVKSALDSPSLHPYCPDDEVRE